MDGFLDGALAKLARFAVGKGAAFSYAVAVGVAGNVIFHYVQPRDAVPAVASAPAVVQPGRDSATAGPASVIAPKPPPASAAPTLPPTRVSLPSEPVRPPPPNPAAPAPAAPLPEPPATISLPGPAALPAP